MTTLANLEPATAVELSPGDEASFGLTVRNRSDIVDAYRFEVVGDAAGWATVEPETITVYPGAEETVQVTFRPPRLPEVAPGEAPFAVRVVPTEHPDEVQVPEGMLHVLPFTELTAEVLPRTSRARRTARHQLAVDNRGNVPVTAEITAADPDGALAFLARPVAVLVQPGEAAFSKVRVRHRRLVWRGQPTTRTFQLGVSHDGEPPLAVDGATVQEPVIPRWTVRAAVFGLLAIAALAALWFGALRPSIRSAARDAIATPLKAVEQRAADAQDTASKAKTEAATTKRELDKRVPQPTPNTTPGPGTQPPPPPPGVTTSQFSRQLSAEAAGGKSAVTVYRVPGKTTLLLTDLILQNPQGDSGRLDISIDGKPALTSSLANFRDLDYHFVSALQANAGSTVELKLACEVAGPQLAGTSGHACRAFVALSGSTRTLAQASPSPPPQP
jgi:hypothetical protein